MTEQFIERLQTLRDLTEPPEGMSTREFNQKKKYLRHFANQLFRDAMAFKYCDASDAVTAVYLSGLWHGACLGSRARE